jgi:UDP-N-acetylmuramate--alanine ligase
MKKKKLHVHFMGIGGSALSGVAILAKRAGFKVSGCELQRQTAYSPTLSKFGIKPFFGHDVSHLKGVDLVAVSPALLFNHPLSAELLEAEKKRILITWQEFLGRFLQKDKQVIAIAGTHGKSTVTALLGFLAEGVGVDPTVEVGALIPQWGATVRFGLSDYFICEADEFNYNFLHYSPGVIILNNLEMDHPEFFQNFDHFLEAFVKFIQKIKEPKILIVNEEDQGVQKLLGKMKGWLVKEKVKVIGFFLEKQFSFPFFHEYQGISPENQKTDDLTRFRVKNNLFEQDFMMKLPGVHNIYNALGAIACGFELGFSGEKMKKALSDFKGLGRRFELIGEEKGIKVYDDYAVHPTAVEATLQAALEKYPKAKIWAVFEPHQFSRLKLFLNEFAQSLDLADQVIITPIYQGREKDNQTIKESDLVDKIGKKAQFLSDFDLIVKTLTLQVKKGEIIIVFGAGYSYQLARMILSGLKNEERN